MNYAVFLTGQVMNMPVKTGLESDSFAKEKPIVDPVEQNRMRLIMVAMILLDTALPCLDVYGLQALFSDFRLGVFRSDYCIEVVRRVLTYVKQHNGVHLHDTRGARGSRGHSASCEEEDE